MLDEEWLEAMKEAKWLRTSRGYNPPRGSVLLQSAMDADAVLKITSLPVVDEMFYGSKIGSYSSELMLLEVVIDLENVHKLIAENLTFPADLSSMTADSGMLILRCVRDLGPSSSCCIERIMNQSWLKTSSGIKSPLESILPHQEWGCLLKIVEVPVIDEAFYGNAMRSFTEELKLVGVAVDFGSALKLIVAQFKSLSSSSSLNPNNVILLLDYIREMSKTMPSQFLELHSFLLEEKWLKTRHGYKTTSESILFNSKWGTITVFIDLPLIDDSFYSIGIYGYKDELKMMGVITDLEEGAEFVARGLKHSIEPGFLTAEGTISLLECFKYLMLKSHEQPLIADFLSKLVGSKWLKTQNGYRNPQECILFDPAWNCILELTDAPIIDERFYGTSISVYKNQLKSVGVKVDPEDVCSILFRILSSHSETSSITRIYSFLNKFYLNPESSDRYNSQVWIPSGKGTSGGKWVKSQFCVLHDNNLFSSRLFSLDRYYEKELLPIFSLVFGVAEFPSINDYLQLWENWISRTNQQVTAFECCAFWGYVLDNWNPVTEKVFKRNLTKIPATSVSGEEIQLVSKEEVFIPDDLRLKKMFMSFNRIPLLVWFPNCSRLSSVPASRLYEVYSSLGVRKISDSVECNVGKILSLDQSNTVDPRNGLIEKGLIKIVLGFLAGPLINMAVKERQGAAKSLLDLAVFVSDELIRVSYRLLQSANRTLEAETKTVVFWDKNSLRLLIDRSVYGNRKTNIEFASCFAHEIAEGLLAQERAEAIDNLSKIIQMGFVFKFKDDSVDFLLTRENLELFLEDKEFLDVTFPSSKLSNPSVHKRTYQKLKPLGPSTPVGSCKRRCQ